MLGMGPEWVVQHNCRSFASLCCSCCGCNNVGRQSFLCSYKIGINASPEHHSLIHSHMSVGPPVFVCPPVKCKSFNNDSLTNTVTATAVNQVKTIKVAGHLSCGGTFSFSSPFGQDTSSSCCIMFVTS